MKTLVIHPADKTTDVLKPIYEGKDWTVITNCGISNKELTEAIKAHDRIIMMGHGTPYGLIALVRGNGTITDFRLIINSQHAYLLREKYCIGIWCNADQFFLRYGLTGKYTGMIISELEEAEYTHISANQAQIDESIDLFTKLMTGFVNETLTLNEVVDQYKNVDNPITDFNRIRIYETNII